MSTPSIPSSRLAELLDWDETSSREHFEAMDRLFESISDPEEVIALARAWWSDPDERVQALGFDLLAVQALNFCWHVPPLIEAADALPLDRKHEFVREAAAHALATICDDERVLFPLLRFAADPDADIRWQVARGIPVGVDPLPEDAVRVLLALMRDPDAEVRDWATMKLGSRAENDTKEIRDAFVERLDDPGANTAGEAAVALAIRHDPRVLPTLKRVLATPDVGNLYVEAAAELGDPELLPLLERLKTDGWPDDDEPRHQALDQALQACASRPASRA
ncbi:HEAT repeat domain-containing protein [Microtetraspora malaysiensis]|uniref:HEAT repeat domain-containing protein n=1 Tax=Microtetraspora malaysiensis TaxID=161358 RepID=UPI000A065DEE|nr:HEAT repeat domain-containing protein [Microtetraspora malaysiensis]